jgi:hypothetical protein
LSGEEKEVDLLILGRTTPTEDPAYRGVDRDSPYYVDRLPDDHPVNQAFRRYMHEINTLGIVHDLAAARELVRTYSALSPPQRFEIIAVQVGDCAETGISDFLGFDLAAGFHISLLSRRLEVIDDAPSREASPEADPIQPMLRVLRDFFQPHLNKQGLFDDYGTAALCLSYMMALQRFRPNLWEGEGTVFEVVGLRRIPLR